ncbi:cAMP-binding domain of CRP or a regulatory subunit of cAMP-dependent protein kinases [Flexibacter flexilis DSM 6793]|uniref:cAMP-binding domain of CRP or a regulatory subunit of cAMP-dependent protein kinases n=1 Tax=Flexibacter flexilis DSM 6793 TaxID=927664 RepID=A0A1I1EHZ3_9BACT|nr:Crp/Fnr family transcriptional regulator [Flexibacter flexilis]SFB84573.1 cAMP-binding domain of CRP or a regulatory subunit of cAMP-dependent protein kinases [Flexibacter flexilis DSM 6793]
MREFFRSLGVLTEQDITALEQVSSRQTLPKGAFFVREGQVCEQIAFVEKGILRSFYTTADGEEMTYCLLFDNILITALSSLISGRPTPENIQALAQTELIIFAKKDFETLINQNVNWLMANKILLEQQYMELEQRVFSLQKDKAAERYQKLLTQQPHYIQQIPVQYLASFLGITRRHLSRLRRELMP